MSGNKSKVSKMNAQKVTAKVVETAALAPLLKWVGGKRQLIREIDRYLPQEFTTYYEPFVGGGAVLFHLHPSKAVINDSNEELINVYRVVRDSPDDLIVDLRNHRNEKEYFYEIRSIDRDPLRYKALSKVERASRIIFLNRACFNGLFRVNQAGEYNTPFGRYKNPDFVNEKTLRAVSSYLNKNSVKILNGSYKKALRGIRKGSLVYFDPPYDPLSESSSFTGYTRGGFGKIEQEELKECCDLLHGKGVKFLLSNSATAFIKDLYRNYDVSIIEARRAINSKAHKRGPVSEVLVKNY
jgi:DNA adenine methylase